MESGPSKGNPGPPAYPRSQCQKTGGDGVMRDLSQVANKINLKKTLTIKKIFDFLGALCKPIGPHLHKKICLPLFSPILFFSPFFSQSFLERRGGARSAPPGDRTPLKRRGLTRPWMQLIGKVLIVWQSYPYG